jgi:NADPH-dependent curcumin reductase CurA
VVSLISSATLHAVLPQESKFEGLVKGDLVGCIGMCQTHTVQDGGGVNKLDPALGVADQMGPYSLIIGLTAWYGTTQICKVKAGACPGKHKLRI